MSIAKSLILNANTSYKLPTYSQNNYSDVASDIQVFVKDHEKRVLKQISKDLEGRRASFFSFVDSPVQQPKDWLKDNEERFFAGTPNTVLANNVYLLELGFITCMEYYMDDGEFIIVGHSTGCIQMRHGKTGTVLCTLRNIQFPPRPIYSLQFSKTQELVCYAACADGNVYRIEIPNRTPAPELPSSYCIRADPAFECLSTQFYGTPAVLNYATPHIVQRSPALSFGITPDDSTVVVGYADSSIKAYDMETRQVITTYKVHKLRLQLIAPKLQRCHSGQVCALRCHAQKPDTFASASWDRTLRVWDLRCPVGCIMTFEGVDACSDSIDLNRDQCIVGSWQPTQALTLWDLKAKKKMASIRVQNRRPDVDGEYIYACRYWRSNKFNRKGKYALIGGSGTQCVEVINLHNRYISCSYPADGTVLAITSYDDRIAFGGSAPVFSIVSFRDPKHEKYEDAESSDSSWTRPRQSNIDTRSKRHASFASDISDVEMYDEAD